MAQDNVGIGTTTPNQRALLDLSSNDKGLLVPRMTTAQRLAIATAGMPDEGLLVYDTSNQTFFYWDGTQWVEMPTPSDGDWIVNGTDMYSGPTGFTGIGTTTPTAKLHTVGSLRFEGLATGADTTVLIIDAAGNVSTRPIGNDIWDGDQVDDADSDPTNEYNISLTFDSLTQQLTVTDGGGPKSTLIAISDADADSTNEYNISLAYDTLTNLLTITDGGGSLSTLLPLQDSITIIAGAGLTGGGSVSPIQLDANADNGLYVDTVDDLIKLGGTLIENTQINLDNYNLIKNLNGTGQFQVQTNTQPTLTVTTDTAVGINTATTLPQAILQINSTEKGVLVPRMNTTQRDLINSPPLGLIIYNTTDSMPQHFNGICWLSMHQKSCDECGISLSIADSLGVITRTTTDTVSTIVTVSQTSGSPQTVGLYLLQNLPTGASAWLSSYAINGSGTSTLTVTADIFATPGSYPIAVQAVCGSVIMTEIYVVQIDSCYEVTIAANATSYDLQAINNLPGPGNPICVIVTVNPPVKLFGNSPGPAYTSGNLDVLSHVGILNDGEIYGFGGDGGDGGNFSTFGDPGEDGGNALNLTTRTTIKNNGYIFGGGGGGGSVAAGLNFPVVGNFSIGAGGGGGAPDGEGGNILISLLYAQGADGTGGLSGQGGAGGSLNLPITFPIGVATLQITPNAYGGDGASYGLDGTDGSLFANIQITVPFLGTIVNTNVPNPPPTLFPPGGIGGHAIKRNSFPLQGLPDGNYQIFSIRGIIGP